MKRAITGFSANVSTGLLAMALGLQLVSCGGGSDESAPQTVSGPISGVAATGAAISGGLVTLKCASGLSSATTSTSADGSYSFTLDKVVLPCLAQVSYTDGGGDTQTLHAYVGNTGITNITPLTELLLATLLNTPALAPAFASFHNTPLRTFTAQEQRNAITLLASRLEELGLSLPEDVDPVRDTLVAKTVAQDGNTLDQLLDALKEEMHTRDISQFQLGLFVTLGMPLDTAQHFSPEAGTSSEEQELLSQSLISHAMNDTHSGTLSASTKTCAFSVASNGNIALGFLPPNTPSSLVAKDSPMADGLSISLNSNLNGITVIERDPTYTGPGESYTWILLSLGNRSSSNFFQLTGSSGVSMATLRYVVRDTGTVNEQYPAGLYYVHRELEITLPTSSSSQNSSATCVVPEQQLLPV